jgi:hypothetical protein
MEMHLADGEVKTVPWSRYSKGFKRSDKMEAEVLTDGKNIKGYKFSLAPFGEFTVDPAIIN